jgi:ribosomal protein L16 Arg81 hydroxylase
MSEQTKEAVKLTLTHQRFFEDFAERAMLESLADAGEEAAKALMSQIDMKEYSRRFGEAVLSKVSYSQVKAVDKFMQSDDFIAVLNAVAHAVESVEVTQDDVANMLFAAGFVLETANPAIEPELYAEARAIESESSPAPSMLDSLASAVTAFSAQFSDDGEDEYIPAPVVVPTSRFKEGSLKAFLTAPKE